MVPTPFNTENQKKLHGEGYVSRFETIHNPMRLERLVSYIKLEPYYEVADFGCGNGVLARYVAPNVRAYVGVDFSESFIKRAQSYFKRFGPANVEFHCASIEDFCCARPQRFDAAFAMDFSEHVPDIEWLKILRSIRTALKPGASLYLHTPNATFFLEKMKAHNFIAKQFPEHVAVRSAEENARLLREAGFFVGHIRKLAHYNILRLLHPLSYLPFLGTYFEARLLIEAHA